MHDTRFPVPTSGFVMTLFLTVTDVGRSSAFYADVLGGTIVQDSDPAAVRLSNAWIIMNRGGEPTPDKPGVTLVVPDRSDRASSFLNLRVADIDASYRAWKGRGAEFLTPPLRNGDELRCYLRDPDGYLIEVGQSIGVAASD